MYEVIWVKGDYRDRQLMANEAGADLYLEQHLNATTDDTTNYPLAVLASNASMRSQEIADAYVKAVEKEFGFGPRRVKMDRPTSDDGHGHWNLYYTRMPAVLLEPLFITSRQGQYVLAANGVERLADVLVAVIREYLPNGGKVAFSVGHKYKTSNPDDRGAIANGFIEAEYAEAILARARVKLEAICDEGARRYLLNAAQRLRAEADTLEVQAGKI